MSHIIKAITKEVQDTVNTNKLVLEDFIEGNPRFIANKANTDYRPQSVNYTNNQLGRNQQQSCTLHCIDSRVAAVACNFRPGNYWRCYSVCK